MGGAPVRSVPVGELRRLGDHALLIGVSDAAAARRLTRVLSAARLEGVAEVVGGLATVMVAFDPMTDAIDLEGRRQAVAHLVEETLGLTAGAGEVEGGAVEGGAVEGGAVEGGADGDGVLVEIACTFDGPDLAEVAVLVGSSPEAVVAMITAGPLTVAAVGFSPGFAYLAGLPAALRDVPRRSRPRPSVAAGSVALANNYAAVYPSASPGGWQLIGHTRETLFTPVGTPLRPAGPR